jgi:transposase
MKQRPRIYFSDSQKALMWERWKQGWTLHQIAQLFDRGHTSVQGVLARTGGIKPPERTRSETALTLAEREEISRAVAEGRSIRTIAARLGRAASTVSGPMPPGKPLRFEPRGPGGQLRVFTADYVEVGELGFKLNPHAVGLLLPVATGEMNRLEFEYIGPDDILKTH